MRDTLPVFSVEGIMRTVVIEAMSEGIDEGLELIEAVGQVVDGIELVSPGAVQRSTAPFSWGRLGGST
jgi:hypothetical protein